MKFRISLTTGKILSNPRRGKKLLIKLGDKLSNALRLLNTIGNIAESFYNYCYSSGSQV